MSALITLIAFWLDSLLGDPHNWPHPTRFIGRLIEFGERRARTWASSADTSLLDERLRRAGAFIVLGVVLTTMAVTLLLLLISYILWPPLYFFMAIYAVYSALCLKDLSFQTWRVEDALRQGDLEAARHFLSWIVGRETAKLDKAGIRRAVVETLAENLADGLIAPLFYLALGGPIFAWGYKAINTMDSMLGYKNEKYLNLGRVAAKVDDVANYIPARLAALLLVMAAAWQKANWREAMRIWRRDATLHSSPNAGHPEAAMAGALGLWLGGPNYYSGQLVPKPSINEGGAETDDRSIKEAISLVTKAALLALLFTLITVFCLGWGWF